MIFEIVSGQLVPRRSLTELLEHSESLEKPEKKQLPRIAAVGAGGKTTVLKRIAAEYESAGVGTVLTTTTHMRREAGAHFLENPSFEQIVKMLKQNRYVLTGSSAQEGKIGSLSKELMEKIFQLPYPVLVEADGARGLPIKIPAEHEPVLPRQTTCVLSVYGLEAVGRRISDICFRPGLAAKVLGKSVSDIVEPGDLAALAISSCGGRKDVELYMEYVIVLNQADTKEQREYAQEIWQAVKSKQDVRIIVISNTSWTHETHDFLPLVN